MIRIAAFVALCAASLVHAQTAEPPPPAETPAPPPAPPTDPGNGRIVGGKRADPGTAPWQAELYTVVPYT
jgi:hypothetical protein